MTNEQRKQFMPNPKIEALVRKAVNDPRLSDEQREKAAARLIDLKKLKTAIKEERSATSGSSI
ncbi:MAG: hypothetical protein A3H25_10725 [Sphingomonadales bacterium RIFCSPLOWO2_12_FULL_63_15]|nr:MAG: hypothetical protein A3H25_10725 [Sphingomonadales bacterium RIFCSPLOWO2_12_FULL_63_15]